MDAKGEVEDVHDEAGGEADGVLGGFGQCDGQQQDGQKVNIGVDEAKHVDVVAHQNLERQKEEEAQNLFGDRVIHLPFFLLIGPSLLCKDFGQYIRG